MTIIIPRIQQFFCGVVIHHGVVTVLVCELYVWVPLFACLGVISKVDGGGIAAIVVDTVNHSTGHKSIAHRCHWFCLREKYANVSEIRSTNIQRYTSYFGQFNVAVHTASGQHREMPHDEPTNRPQISDPINVVTVLCGGRINGVQKIRK